MVDKKMVELFRLAEPELQEVAKKYGFSLGLVESISGTWYYHPQVPDNWRGDQLQFEMKFYSSEYEWSFAADKTFKEVVQHIEGYYEELTFVKVTDGLQVFSGCEIIGILRPVYPFTHKVKWLHSLL